MPLYTARTCKTELLGRPQQQRPEARPLAKASSEGPSFHLGIQRDRSARPAESCTTAELDLGEGDFRN